PLPPARQLEVAVDGVGQLEEVVDIGRGVSQLRVGQRADPPVGEAVALGQLPTEEGLGEGSRAGRGVSTKAGAQLGFEQPAGPRPQYRSRISRSWSAA